MLQHEKDVRGSFWAAYFNIATNNVQTILRHVSGERQRDELRSQEFSVEQPSQQDDTSAKDKKRKSDLENDRALANHCAAIQTLQAVGTEADLTKQLRIMKNISKALPFMGKICQQIETGKSKNGKVLEQPRTLTPQEFAGILLGYVNYLFELRNYFTHVKHAPVSKVEMSTDYLIDIFNANIGTAKERFYPEDKIANDDRRFLNFRKYKGMKKELDKDGKEVEKPKDNPNFTFYLWEPDPAGSAAERGTSSPRREPTAQGLAFFCCLFLEKKYANMALDSIGIQNGQNNLIKQFGIRNPSADLLTLIKRVFTITCARLPRTRIESESLMTNQVLGLDMLSTLHKCPRQLFELLSPQDQNKFRTESEETGQEVLLRRFEDRFPYLTLNYLDRCGNFGNLRFCIDMGNFYFRCHPRTQIDGFCLEDRRLKKRITCYTKIQEAMDYYQAERVRPGTLYHVATPDNPNPPQTYRLDMVPQYEISDNRVGIALKSSGKNDRPLFNQPELPVGQPKGKDKPKTYQPDAWLPIHELMPILFLATHGKANEIENAIANHIQRWRALLNDFMRTDMQRLKAMRWSSSKQSREAYCRQFREQYGVDIMDIPDEMRYYLFNGKVKSIYLQSQGADQADAITADDAAEIWLCKEVENNRALIRRFAREQDYDFKLGKGKQPRFTSGYIARWLVRDFMRFQKSNGKAADRFGKLKSSPDYMALQSALACFDSRRQDMRQLLVHARLIDGANYDHPFLKEVLSSQGSLESLIAFFKNYLKKRLDWLRCADGIDAYQLRRLYKRNEIKTRVQKGQLQTDRYFSNMAAQLIKEPVCLPRGLFDSLVRKTLQEEFPEQFAAEVSDGQRANFTWLMQKYLQWSGDEPQWFYSLKASKNASQFKSLFDFMETADLRYDSTGLKALNEKLDEKYQSRRDNLEQLLRRDRRFINMCENEFQNAVDKRMEEDDQEEDDQMYRRLLNQLRDVWKEIRMVGVQDIILRDAIWQLLNLPQNEIRLQDVQPEYDLQQRRKERMLNPERVIAGELTNDSLLNRKVELVNKVSLPNGEGTILLTGKMKRKNFGNFFRMLSDPRIISFLKLYHEFGIETVDYDFLELQEFEAYDRIYRPLIFDLVHELEKTVLKKYPEVYVAKDGYTDFWSVACKANGGDEFLSVLLAMFRNAFAHQYYPEYRSLASWKKEDKQQYDPLFQKLRDEIKADYLQRRQISPQNEPALLIALIAKRAESLFRKAINNVKLSMD